MSNYVLEDARENERLERQAKLSSYALTAELRGVALNAKDRILDAGCGTGLLGRHLRETYGTQAYIGLDVSAERLKEARLASPGLRFDVADLFDRASLARFRGQVDVLFNRYVMHHVRDHHVILENFYDVLPEGGRLCIVDIDGIFVNVGTPRSELARDIQRVADGFGGDLTVGRRLPALLAQAGFRDIRWEIQTMDFQGEERADEVQQFAERLEFARPTITRVLGSELAYKRFVKDYLTELASPTTAVFYNKFIIQAVK